MKMMDIRKMHVLFWGLTALVVITIAGCASSTVRKGQGQRSSFFSFRKSKPAAPVYLDFGDILIPGSLQVDRNTSFVFRNPSFTGGVLSLKGKVELNSLIEFFSSNMARDNWKEVTSFKSWRSILLFKKDNRWCVINITDRDFNTHVDIWVAPNVTGAPDSGLIKGEDLQ